MSSRRRSLQENRVATVAERMTEAVIYLSKVAHEAGLHSISEDLLSIKEKLGSDSLATHNGALGERRKIAHAKRN